MLNNEEVQSEDLVIGGNAGPDSPFTNRRFCFNIVFEEDNVKETNESFALSLQSDDDECVWLGRDGAIIYVQANGGKNTCTYSHFTIFFFFSQ